MKKRAKDKPTKFARDAGKAMQSAVKRVMREHKRKKIPLAIWKDGRVQMIPPEKISVA